jgi:hypothetical protein
MEGISAMVMVLTHYSTTVNAIIMAAIALGVIVAVDMVVFPALEAWAAGCPVKIGNGTTSGTAFEASKGRCVH